MQKWIVLLVGLCFALSLSAQSSQVFFNKKGEEIKSQKRAAFVRSVEPRADGTFVMRYATIEGVLVWQSVLKGVNPDVPVNKISYYPDGKIQKQEDYTRGGVTMEFYPSGLIKNKFALDSLGRLNGEVLSFHENGQPLRRDLFRDGALVSGTCYNASGEEVPHYPFFQNAVYLKRAPGMQGFIREWVNRELLYPRGAMNNLVQGVVMVGFTVKKNGTVGDVVLLKGVDLRLDTEALKLVSSSPAWASPALMNNEPVEAYYVVPVAFVLQ